VSFVSRSLNADSLGATISEYLNCSCPVLHYDNLTAITPSVASRSMKSVGLVIVEALTAKLQGHRLV
jgi:hypothetical protein